MYEIVYILAALIVIFRQWNRSKDRTEKFSDCLITCLITGLAYLIIFYLVGLQFRIEDYRADKQSPILSLRNSENLSGSFFLGTGRINTDEHYFTFIQDSGGGYRRFKVPVHHARLVLDDNEQPKIKWQEIHYKTPAWFSFHNGILHPYGKERTEYTLIVPESTIIQKFEVK